MTTIEKIRAEIERRKQEAINNCGGYKTAREHECDKCLVGQYEEIEDIIATLDETSGDLDEPIDGLEEEIERFEDWVETYNQADYPTSFTTRDIARHFAQWGAEHRGSSEIPNDLEEAALSRMRDPDMYLSDAVIDEIGDELLKMAQFGAKWQKEQMMKDAVEGQVLGATDVNQLYEGKVYIISNLFQDIDFGLSIRDKVKIIIVKED